MRPPPPPGYGNQPHAQPQPPYGQPQPPYAQPGQPAQPAQVYGPPVPGQPGQPATKQPNTKRNVLIGAIIAGVVVLLALCGGGGYVVYSAFGAASYKVGDCVKQQKAGIGSKAVPVGCAEDGAYRVVAKFDDTTSDAKCPAAPATEASFVNYQDRYVLCMKRAKP